MWQGEIHSSSSAAPCSLAKVICVVTALLLLNTSAAIIGLGCFLYASLRASMCPGWKAESEKCYIACDHLWKYKSQITLMLLNQRYHNTHTQKKKEKQQKGQGEEQVSYLPFHNEEGSKFLTYQFQTALCTQQAKEKSRGASFMLSVCSLLFIPNKRKRRKASFFPVPGYS